MLDILLSLQKKAPIDFEILAVNLDQKQPDFPEHVLPDYLGSLGVPFHILEQDTYSVVKRVVPEGKTLCGLCSRLRRGSLYTFAKARGMTKIALGHHRDDIVETLFLNMFFGGKTPLVSAPDLERMGYKIEIIPSDAQRAAIRAMQRVFAVLKTHGEASTMDDDMASFLLGGLGEVEDEDVHVHGAGEPTHGDQGFAVFFFEGLVEEVSRQPELIGVVVRGVLEGVSEGDAFDVDAVSGHAFRKRVLPAAGIAGEKDDGLRGLEVRAHGFTNRSGSGW
jgi:hypothetical protein